jgi:hypothetical protein
LLVAVDGIVLRQLREARRWLTLEQFLEYAVWTLLVALGVLVISRMAPPQLQASVPGIATILISIAIAFAGALWRWKSVRVVARELDARAHTKDRFLTALDLPASEESLLSDAARRETSRFAARLRVGDYMRPRLPWRNALWLLLPLAALGIIEGLKEWRAGQLAPELASARQLLEQASEVAERQAEVDKEFKHVAEKLKEAEHELAESSEPLREALRTLAELEERLSRPSELSDAERSALADALAQNHPELASDLRAGRNAEAARTVAQLDPAELAKALEQAARHLESRRLRELANEEGQMVQVQLGMMLGASGEFGKEDGRRQFVATLREMKTGLTSAAAQDGQKGAGFNPSQHGEKSASSGAEQSQPAGAPGSEMDLGRGAELGEEAEPVVAQEGSEDFLEGELGDGASLVQLFRAAGGDDPQARRAYRSAYQVAAPAALDAVNQEKIPAGSRLLVRRYFESIRPKE